MPTIFFFSERSPKMLTIRALINYHLWESPQLPHTPNVVVDLYSFVWLCDEYLYP